MRKIGLLIGAFLISFNCVAATTIPTIDIKSAIYKGLTSHPKDTKKIVYGGQDVSQLSTVSNTSFG